MTSDAAIVIMRPLILAAICVVFAITAAAMDAAATATTAFPAPPHSPPGHRLTLTPRADSHNRHGRSTGDGGGTFDMVATAGFDLSADTIEICTSAARCGTFSRDIPGWRAGDPVPDAEFEGGPRRYWWGHDGNSTLNLITHGADDRVFGSMVDGRSLLIYSFGADAEGAPLVRASHTSQFTELPPLIPDEGAGTEEGLPGDPGFGSPTDADGPSRQRRADDGSELDIMVLWTVASECRQSSLLATCTPTSTTFGNMVAMIELAVAETNTACKRPSTHPLTPPPTPTRARAPRFHRPPPPPSRHAHVFRRRCTLECPLSRSAQLNGSL